MKPDEYHLPRSTREANYAGGFGLAALLLCGIGAVQNPSQFYHSWLVAVFFVISIALGALFLNMVFHLSGASWSMPIRRLLESLATTMPLLFLLFLPILVGLHELYHWSHTDAVIADHLLKLKSPFLNPPFFIIRSLIYFAIWIFFAQRLHRLSVAQETVDGGELAVKMRQLSAGGLILFALTVTFASFDWLMSLDAHWYSTIFGLYVFAGCVVAGLAAVILLSRFLQYRGHLRQTIGSQQYHDLGRLLFAFTVFWAYMAVSQYFLIWYGNIPEETIWYHHRWHGSWKSVSLLLAFGHFMVPFIVLLTRWAKQNLFVLSLFSIWLLIMHWIDLQWLVMPVLHVKGIMLSWMDGAALVGVLGISVWFLMRILSQNRLAPGKGNAPS